MKDPFDSLSRITDIKMPVFMMHGTQDEVIPFALAWELYEAAPQPKGFYTLQGAMHSDLYVERFQTPQRVHDFLQKIHNAAPQ